MTAVPYVFGALAMVLWTRHSDRTMERTWHVAAPAILGGLAFVAAASTGSPVLGMVALTVAAMGILAALPTAMLTGSAAAGGIALINSIGNLGGFVGPYMVGWVKDSTGQFSLGLVCLAAFLVAAGLLTLAISRRSEASAPGYPTAPAE